MSGNTTSDRFDRLFRRFCRGGPIPWTALKAQAQAESGVYLVPSAMSPAGAMGIAQFMPRTWEEWRPADGASPFCPFAAIEAMAAYMRWLYERYDDHGDETIALARAAYNWGCGNVDRIQHAPDWRDKLPRETRDYLSRIERYEADA